MGHQCDVFPIETSWPFPHLFFWIGPIRTHPAEKNTGSDATNAGKQLNSVLEPEKNPFINGCFNWITLNQYMKKIRWFRHFHPSIKLEMGCFRFLPGVPNGAIFWLLNLTVD